LLHNLQKKRPAAAGNFNLQNSELVQLIPSGFPWNSYWN